MKLWQWKWLIVKWLELAFKCAWFRTYVSKRSPNTSEWSTFSGRKTSSICKTFPYPFLNSGSVHVKRIIDKKFVFSRGFGRNFRCIDSIFIYSLELLEFEIFSIFQMILVLLWLKITTWIHSYNFLFVLGNSKKLSRFSIEIHMYSNSIYKLMLDRCQAPPLSNVCLHN